MMTQPGITIKFKCVPTACICPARCRIILTCFLQNETNEVTEAAAVVCAEENVYMEIPENPGPSQKNDDAKEFPEQPIGEEGGQYETLQDVIGKETQYTTLNDEKL